MKADKADQKIDAIISAIDGDYIAERVATASGLVMEAPRYSTAGQGDPEDGHDGPGRDDDQVTSGGGWPGEADPMYSGMEEDQVSSDGGGGQSDSDGGQDGAPQVLGDEQYLGNEDPAIEETAAAARRAEIDDFFNYEPMFLQRDAPEGEEEEEPAAAGQGGGDPRHVRVDGEPDEDHGNDDEEGKGVPEGHGEEDRPEEDKCLLM